jgi:hypothetical protein
MNVVKDALNGFVLAIDLDETLVVRFVPRSRLNGFQQF